MNPRDAIITALTPGSPFNAKGLLWRSVGILAAFATEASGEEISAPDVVDLLNGDLAAEVTCKPSTKGKGLLVARQILLPVEQEQPVAIAGGPAFNAPVNPVGVPEIDDVVGADEIGQAQQEAAEDVEEMFADEDPIDAEYPDAEAAAVLAENDGEVPA